MPTKSELRLIKNAMEYLPMEEVKAVPRKVRGIYVLYTQKGRKKADAHHYDVVYVGMGSGIRGRLIKHIKYKKGLWTHFSVFEVWDNIDGKEIKELEGLFRHLYRYDAKANLLNKQRGYKPLNKVTKRSLTEWI